MYLEGFAFESQPTCGLTFVVRPLNLNVEADGWSYFDFKCPSLRLSGPAFLLSAVNRQRAFYI
jgi:hypothetical protein